MAIVDELYRPTHVLMPVGDKCTLSPFDAAYACKQFLNNCQTLIPMYFSSLMNETM